MGVKEKVKVYICDFCGRDSDEVAKIVVTVRDVAICDECVDACVKVLAQPSDVGTPATSVGNEGEHQKGPLTP